MESVPAVFWAALVVLWLASAVFCAWLAEVKGRDGFWWILWGLLFGIVALIAIAGAPSVPIRLERQCPNCDESISIEALVCHWCGTPQSNPQSPRPSSDIDALAAEEASAVTTEDQTADDSKGDFMVMAVGIGAVVFFVIAIIVVSAATGD